MADQVRTAFLDFLAAECARQPVILVLEDLHWGDALTVALVDAALRQLAGLPLLVLALARPEVKESFPRLWADRRMEEVRLRGLSRKACARLATQVLGPRASESTIARIVEQAAGNALILEELIRAVAEDKDAARPDTVLALLQSRLLRIETGPRRVLRAASVFGERFWRGGVLELLRTSEQPDRWFETLIDLEFIERHRDSRFPGEIEYQFRHALVRDAAYSLLTHEDRELGHRLASAYLQRIGENDPLVLAEHHQHGGEPGRALPFYVAAAEQAFSGNDMMGALQRAERGVQCGASGETLGLLRNLQCKVCVERADWAAALSLGKEALSLLPRGGLHFCEAMGYLVVVAGIAAPESFPELVAEARATEPAPDALPAFIMADCGLVLILTYLGLREHVQFFLQRAERLIAHCRKDAALVRGVILQARGVYTWMLSADPWLQQLQESVRLLAENGAVRAGLLTECYVAIAQSELGDYAAAEALLRKSLATAQHLCIPFRIVVIKLYLAIILARSAQPHQHEEADALAAELIVTPGVNAVTIGQAYSGRAQVAAARGRFAESEQLARKACALLRRAPPLWFSPMKLLIESLVEQGSAEARELALTGQQELARLGCVGYQTIGFGLAAARAHHAAGDPASARRLLLETLQDLHRRALCIPNPQTRARFLEQVPDNVRARALARDWQLPVADCADP